MAFDKRAALCVLAMATLCLCRASFSQEARSAGDANDVPVMQGLLDDLKNTPPFKRSEKVPAIVKRGREVGEEVPIIIDEVGANLAGTDASYVANCIVALESLSARGATDVLIRALRSPSAQIAYQAAWALGKIWQNADAGAEQLPRLNAALLAAIYRTQQARDLTGMYGPAMALAQINRIDINSPEPLTSEDLKKEILKLKPEELRDTIDTWVRAHPDRFPPLDDQPWEVLLEDVLTGRASQASSIIVRNRPLAAVGTLTACLRRENGSLSQPVRGELERILVAITEVQLPDRKLYPTSGALVDAWMESWIEELKTHSEPAYLIYVLEEYERAIRKMKAQPDARTAAEAELFKDAMLHMFGSLEDLPEQASEEVRKLLGKALGLKKVFVTEIEGLNRVEGTPEKLQHIGAMQAAIDAMIWKRVGGQYVIDDDAMALNKQVARQFVPSLIEFARTEMNREVLSPLGKLLESITDLPCRLAQPSDEQRNRAIDEWLRQLEEQKSAPTSE